MTIPPLLVPGDEVLVISPSSHPTTDRWIPGIEVLEAWGLKVRRGKHYLSGYEGFGGTDEERLEDLQVGLNDPNIKAVAIQPATGSPVLGSRGGAKGFLSTINNGLECGDVEGSTIPASSHPRICSNIAGNANTGIFRS